MLSRAVVTNQLQFLTSIIVPDQAWALLLSPSLSLTLSLSFMNISFHFFMFYQCENSQLTLRVRSGSICGGSGVLERATGRKWKVHERQALKFSAPRREADREVQCIFHCAKQDGTAGSCTRNPEKLALTTDQRINTARHCSPKQTLTGIHST